MSRRNYKLGRLATAGLALVCLLVATPATAQEWQTYLEDDFETAESLFYTGQAGEAFYAIDDQGRYVIDGASSSRDSLSSLTDNLYYYYVEATCEVLGGSGGDLAYTGLIFHYNKKVRPGAYAYYVFYVYADGYYGAKRVIGDDVSIILPLTRTELTDVYGQNVLGVDAQGTHFDLYLNGRLVDSFTDVRIDGGGTGFYASKETQAAFDNFAVKVERRSTGYEEPDMPGVVESGTAPDTFEGYKPPIIPRDPNRPIYPWEVGVDKSGKDPVDEAPAETGEPVESGEDTEASDAGDVEVELEEPSRPADPPSQTEAEVPDPLPLIEPEEPVTTTDELALLPTNPPPAEAAEEEFNPVIPDLSGNQTPASDETADDWAVEIDTTDAPAEDSAGELSLTPEPVVEPPAETPRQPSSRPDPFANRLTVRTVEDDFSDTTIWPVSNSGPSRYSYFGAAYEINNLAAETMAISYQQGTFGDAELTIDSEYLDGLAYVGFGVATRFMVSPEGQVSYYALFVSRSGEYLLLKVLNGKEHVLKDWTATTVLDPTASNRIGLVAIGGRVSALINDEEVVTVLDSDIPQGGYALLAGPGVSARFDNLLLRGIAAPDA